MQRNGKSEFGKELLNDICNFRSSQNGCAACEEKGNTDVCDESIDAVYSCYLASD